MMNGREKVDELLARCSLPPTKVTAEECENLALGLAMIKVVAIAIPLVRTAARELGFDPKWAAAVTWLYMEKIEHIAIGLKMHEDVGGQFEAHLKAGG